MSERIRRVIVVLISLGVLTAIVWGSAPAPNLIVEQPLKNAQTGTGLASTTLETLAVKGRAPKTGYSRDQYGSGWSTINGCDTRTIILNRDLQNPVLDEECRVIGGTLNDTYTGKIIIFSKETAAAIQIDHVVALSDAWQKGAQLLTRQKRIQLANDPIELLAVDGPANQAKGDADAASWLPSNKTFRCQYVARQIAVKQKYSLWVTDAEMTAMKQVLASCPTEGLPTP
ncbi:MAG: HNH endonuclease family protein [Candidatus Saccharimonadales bacterium]